MMIYFWNFYLDFLFQNQKLQLREGFALQFFKLIFFYHTVRDIFRALDENNFCTFEMWRKRDILIPDSGRKSPVTIWSHRIALDSRVCLATLSPCHLATLQHCRHCSCLPCHWAPRRHSKRPATSWRRWSSLALFFHPRIGSLSNTVRRFFPWMGGRGGTPQVLQKTGIFCPKTLFLAVLICYWSF